MKSIILIGMPGCGKSTLGVILAKELGLDFVDTDILIQQRTGELLQETLEKKGVSGLLDEEEQAILSLDFSKPCVVSTGGSAPLREKSMEHLKKHGVCIYIKLPCDEIEKRINNRDSRGIAAEKDETIVDIYNYRTPFYEKYADIICDCSEKNVSENVANIRSFVENGIKT
ncbi:MAG: shikimate kinase [Ruminococcaceae bacterium]|nr:shikimate kinase [Oscillospiraceae bacterium]